MSRPPRVFLSHSAKEPLTRQCLEALVSALEDGGFLPVVDYQRLNNGELWWPAVQEEVKSAHAVVVLLSPAALTSDPVHREVTLAMSEREDHRGLERVFVLRVPDVSYELIKQSPLGGAELHRVHSDKVADPDAVRRVVPGMLADIHAAYRERPHELLEAVLEDWLTLAGGAGLRQAALRLGLVPELIRPAALATRVAQRLLEFTGDSVRGVDAAVDFLEVARPSGKGPAQLVDVVLSAAALPDSVRTQVEEVLADPVREAVGVAVQHTRTGRMYLRRACTLPVQWALHPADPVTSHNQLDALVAGIRAYLVEQAGAMGFELSDQELAAELEARELRHGPVTVLVPSAPDPQLVRRLRARFPGVLFLFVAGADGARRPVDGVRWLDPALAADVERRVVMVREQVWTRHGLPQEREKR